MVFIEHKTGLKVELHRPHPGNILKRYQLDILIENLKKLEVI